MTTFSNGETVAALSNGVVVIPVTGVYTTVYTTPAQRYSRLTVCLPSETGMDYRYRISTSSGVVVTVGTNSANAGIYVTYLNAGQTFSVRAEVGTTSPTIGFQAQEFFAP